MKTILSPCSSQGLFWVVASTVFLAGCLGKTTFLKTAEDFVPTPAGQDPVVFIDNLPARPYRSVGVIEINTTRLDLPEVADIVKKKGREVGCDVVVDRAIHRTGMVDDQPLLRFVAAQEIPEELRTSPSRSVAGPQKPAAGLLAYGGMAAQPAPPTPVNVTPETKREFICGVYTQKEVVEETAQNMTLDGVWAIAAGGASPDQACSVAMSTLEQDLECRGEQCRIPLAMVQEFRNRCLRQDPDRTKQVTAWRKRLRIGLPSESKFNCATGLARSLRSKEAAALYRRECVKDRELGHLERKVLEQAEGTPGDKTSDPSSSSGQPSKDNKGAETQ